MLDSLVRVSRRVGQVTDRFATDAERTPGLRPLDDRSRRTLATVPSSRSAAQRRGRTPAALRSSTARRRANAERVYNTAAEAGPPSANASRRRRAGRGARRSESAPAAPRYRRLEAPARRCHLDDSHEADELNPKRRLCGPLRLLLDGFTYC